MTPVAPPSGQYRFGLRLGLGERTEFMAVELDEGGALRSLSFEGDRVSRELPADSPDAVRDGAAAVVAQLGAYARGERESFDLRLAPDGTDFERAVWDKLDAIPFGQTVTYQSIADALGNPGGARAVGAANGKNPIAIVRPCHRVVGASGDLTGYAGGVERKRALLVHEGALLL